MTLNPFDALGNFAVNLIKEGHVQRWCQLVASILISAFASFFGTLSLSIIAQTQTGTPSAVALILAIAHASLVMTCTVIFLWKRSPLTRGIMIVLPTSLVAAADEQLKQDGMTTDPNDKR